ncbi:MAG: hypothetical protein C4329_00960 [Chitinophagaceae bacterium]
MLRPRSLIILCWVLLFNCILVRIILINPLLDYGLPLAHLDGLLTGTLIAISFFTNQKKNE